MNAPPTADQLLAFQGRLSQLLGLRFDDNRPSILAEVLTRRALSQRVPVEVYLERLKDQGPLSAESSALMRELAVGETYFFRHTDQFRAFEEIALPERLSARAHSRTLRLLSAGCASGEEAYSLLIAVRERGVEPAYGVEVFGFDMNPEALEKARRAVYSSWSLRETPPELQERWFVRDGRDYRLLPSVRDAVTFEQHNLGAATPPALGVTGFDVIFCRNVLMYFTPEHAARAVSHLASLLAPGGFLFLGHAETLRGLSHDFQLRHTHDTFYYQLKSRTQAKGAPAPTTALRPETQASLQHSGWVDSWLSVVEKSSQRIRELSQARPAETPAPAVASVPRDLSQSLHLLRHDRFSEALDMLDGPGPEEDAAALLLRAALLAQQGAIAEAQRACHDLLRQDDLNAGAHYLLALCSERNGELEQAVEHDRTAIYLDAGFAMPHLHLGLMARRRHDTKVARAELEQALLLLEREDESRLLLFGGGFSRSALVTLCRSELGNLRAARA